MDLQKTSSRPTGSRTLRGIPLSPGYGVGPARIYRTVSFALSSEAEMPGPSRDESPETAVMRFRKALAASREQLLHLQAKSAATLGQEKAAVFAAQSLMLDDPMLSGGVEELLRKGTSPEDAVVLKTREIKALFESLPDPYLRERAADVEDVGRRIFRNLLGVGTLDLEDVGEPVILVAEDLTPRTRPRSRPKRGGHPHRTGRPHKPYRHHRQGSGNPRSVWHREPLRPD